MDSDQGKVFIGGISWETTEEKLKEHFGKYGQVAQVVILRDRLTGKPRGFGFVAFDNPSDLDAVLRDKHTIDGRTVEAKRVISREEQQNTAKSGNLNFGRSTDGVGGGLRTKKIFVGGLPQTITEEGFRQYFQTYGNVTDVVVMYDQASQRPRGFGFASFDTEDAVDRVLHKTFHDLDGKLVEVKRAFPKDANPNSGGSGANTNAYDGNRYLQPGYGASGYGYGSTTNCVGYGAYNNQAPASYGTNTGYGAPAIWNPHNGGGGGYYGNQSGYGAVGVRSAAPTGGAADQGAGSGGYIGGGYGDANGNPDYSNTWRSDPSQGGGGYGPAGYGGAYGGPSQH